MSNTQGNTQGNKQSTSTIPKKLHCYDDIEVNGRIIYLPDKYIQQAFLSYEQKLIYKYILAMLIDNYLSKHCSSTFNKAIIDKLQCSCDNMFAYLIMGKVTGTLKLTILESSIIDKIPKSLFKEQNLILCEKME
uniref:Uncharacterized protein n=1 Tax=viral metagenome TaxID=1070528 RepID=A0A6C0HLX5_9ZZZZ